MVGITVGASVGFRELGFEGFELGTDVACKRIPKFKSSKCNIFMRKNYN